MRAFDSSTYESSDAGADSPDESGGGGSAESGGTGGEEEIREVAEAAAYALRLAGEFDLDLARSFRFVGDFVRVDEDEFEGEAATLIVGGERGRRRTPDEGRARGVEGDCIKREEPREEADTRECMKEKSAQHRTNNLTRDSIAAES